MTNQEKFEKYIQSPGISDNLQNFIMQIFTFHSMKDVPIEESEQLYIDYIHSEVEKLKSNTKAMDVLESFGKFANAIWDNKN